MVKSETQAKPVVECNRPRVIRKDGQNANQRLGRRREADHRVSEAMLDNDSKVCHRKEVGKG